MAVASLVLGIIALILGIFGGYVGQYIGAVVGLIGIVLGVQGRKNPEKHGIATAGMVCSIIGFIFCIIVVIACSSVLGAAGCAAATSSR